ncbi:hypothetical protein HYFRA_00010250 [Hymenoscyphus fraxineus]|uniref:Glutathione transferase n=1 Tax=Hymenoscyphus fraxineus TaxID=746836 RepID=A0A9N9KSR3_9HELO|nr:hypothetical protein HYFRA_00010250 [Hymenoscyphus fraxineus]
MEQELHGQYRAALQSQSAGLQQHNQPHLTHAHHALTSQPGLDLSGLDGTQYQSLHIDDPNGHAFDPNPYEQRHQNPHDSSHVSEQHDNNATYSLLNQLSHNAIGPIQTADLFGSNSIPEGVVPSSNVHDNTNFVANPPNLAAWRQRLFDVDQMITLSQEEYNTYFPHVDNVYSHRSTQKYKKKQFVSHYWDCRLKGRPPGTPKSDDPNKKKRKRTARERDLCDVKIKITEYFPGAMQTDGFALDGVGADQPQGDNFFPGQGEGQNQPPFTGMSLLDPSHPGQSGKPFYTIQRVNGNGGNGKGDGVPGPHKHDLAESDRVKKNSVQRMMMKNEKEAKKQQKTYHKKASGAALTTVKKHMKDHELKLFGSCFCPWVQKVWIALEAKGLQYQYIEVDPFKKPQALLDINPRGTVPGLSHGNWGSGESTVLMEYLEDLGIGMPLLPTNNPQLRAISRFWSDHINRFIVPAFFKLLQAVDHPSQLEATKKLQDYITEIVGACDAQGPFFFGPHMSYVDVQFAPWMLRFSRVLKHYRNWQDPIPGTRWGVWLEAVENNEHVKNTTSTDDLYVDSYERFAQNRTNSNDLLNAVNGGFSLP